MAAILSLTFSFSAAKLQAQNNFENSANSLSSGSAENLVNEETFRNIQAWGSRISGTWKGTYICGQGLTNLVLKITQRNAPNIGAVFKFSANPENPSVPSGSYRMKGTYNNKTRKITLKATRWIKRPAPYITVNMAGYVSRSNTKMSGKILNSSCSTFSLKRR